MERERGGGGRGGGGEGEGVGGGGEGEGGGGKEEEEEEEGAEEEEEEEEKEEMENVYFVANTCLGRLYGLHMEVKSNQWVQLCFVLFLFCYALLCVVFFCLDEIIRFNST